jgi:hypothetical protein
MGSNERGLVLSGGFTGSLAVITVGFRLAFPDMIVPFGWAMAVLLAGIIGLTCTIIFALRVYLWPAKIDRHDYIAMLQRFSVMHNGIMAKLERVKTDEELDALERETRAVVSHAFAWISENMGMAAASKYGGGIPDPTQFNRIPGLSVENHQKWTAMMQRMLLKIKNINDLLGSDRWDDPIPLKKRRRSKEWKLMKEELGKTLSNG